MKREKQQPLQSPPQPLNTEEVAEMTEKPNLPNKVTEQLKNMFDI